MRAVLPAPTPVLARVLRAAGLPVSLVQRCRPLPLLSEAGVEDSAHPSRCCPGFALPQLGDRLLALPTVGDRRCALQVDLAVPPACVASPRGFHSVLSGLTASPARHGAVQLDLGVPTAQPEARCVLPAVPSGLLASPVLHSVLRSSSLARPAPRSGSLARPAVRVVAVWRELAAPPTVRYTLAVRCQSLCVAILPAMLPAVLGSPGRTSSPQRFRHSETRFRHHVWIRWLSRVAFFAASAGCGVCALSGSSS